MASEGHPRCSKITEVNPKTSKSSEDHPKSCKDFRKLAKVAEVGLQVLEIYQDCERFRESPKDSFCRPPIL